MDINQSAGAVDGEHSLMMVDELMVDPQTALDVSTFDRNSALKRPWGRLDDHYPWAIINVQDPAYFKTTIFQSPDFTAAVQAVVNGGTP